MANQQVNTALIDGGGLGLAGALYAQLKEADVTGDPRLRERCSSRRSTSRSSSQTRLAALCDAQTGALIGVATSSGSRR